MYIIVCGLAVAISLFSVIFCIVCGKGVPRKMLIFFLSMTGIVAVIRLGGAAVLNLFDMGWRCIPANIMIELCIGFFIAALCCCMWQIIALKDEDTASMAWGSGLIVLAIIIALQVGFLHFIFSPHDGLNTYNDETIVCVNEDAGSAAWRYYTHINGLVHGKEILKDDLGGNPLPRSYR